MMTSSKYPTELRERATRLAFDVPQETRNGGLTCILSGDEEAIFVRDDQRGS